MQQVSLELDKRRENYTELTDYLVQEQRVKPLTENSL